MKMEMKMSKTRICLCFTMKSSLDCWEKSIVDLQSETSACEEQMGKWQL